MFSSLIVITMCSLPDETTMSARFSSIAETESSELLENVEKLFLVMQHNK